MKNTFQMVLSSKIIIIWEIINFGPIPWLLWPMVQAQTMTNYGPDQILDLKTFFQQNQKIVL